MNGRYILIGQTAVPCEDLLEWGAWLETADRVVFQTVVGEYFVSTVFLGLDHRFGGGGLPLLFETMIFLRAARELPRLPGEDLGGYFERVRRLNDTADQKLIDYQTRYEDWIAAECGHEKAVSFAETRTGATRAPAIAPVA